MQIIVKGSSSGKTAGFEGVNAALNAIIARADSDPREFRGFKRDWAPTKVLPAAHLPFCLLPCVPSRSRMTTETTARSSLDATAHVKPALIASRQT